MPRLGADGVWTTEKVQEFYDFLKGTVPEGFIVESPKLDSETAFLIIWMLQEGYGAIPDDFEVCEECGFIYNSGSEGARVFCKNYCDNCADSHYPEDDDFEYGSCDGCPEEKSCPFNNDNSKPEEEKEFPRDEDWEEGITNG